MKYKLIFVKLKKDSFKIASRTIITLDITNNAVIPINKSNILVKRTTELGVFLAGFNQVNAFILNKLMVGIDK